jgi:membrane protease YdiL (CAAX protease family)
VPTDAVSTENTTTHRSSSTRRDLLELAIGYLLIMATIWSANPTQRVFYWLAFVWIAGTTLARRDSWTTLGLGRKGLFQSLWVIGAALILSAIAILIAGQTHTLHRLHGPDPLPLHGWAYIIWALMQQFILQSYFLLRLLRLLPGKALPIFIATGIFALAHLPNPILTPLTFIWGTIACVLFLRYRNIYTLGIAHGIMGLCVAITVPNSLHRHMRVGLGYLRYHPRVHELVRDSLPSNLQNPPVHGTDHPTDHRSQSDQSVSTEAWVIADAPTRRS